MVNIIRPRKCHTNLKNVRFPLTHVIRQGTWFVSSQKGLNIKQNSDKKKRCLQTVSSQHYVCHQSSSYSEPITKHQVLVECYTAWWNNLRKRNWYWFMDVLIVVVIVVVTIVMAPRFRIVDRCLRQDAFAGPWRGQCCEIKVFPNILGLRPPACRRSGTLPWGARTRVFATNLSTYIETIWWWHYLRDRDRGPRCTSYSCLFVPTIPEEY